MAKAKTNKPKQYSLTRDERWFVLEHNSFITFYNNLVKSFIDQVVIPRLGLKVTEEDHIRILADASGIEIHKVPKAVPNPEPKKTDTLQTKK